MRILVAEDDTTSRLIIEAAVTSLGHECIVATSGEEAWRLFETADVEVVISDRMMPGMDGLELCRRVRASNKDIYTYFIFLTILDERSDVISGMEAGADDYLIKPLDAVELSPRGSPRFIGNYSGRRRSSSSSIISFSRSRARIR